VLAAKEGSGPGSTSFSLVLEEGSHGEMMVGKNVPLGSSSPPPLAGPPGSTPPVHHGTSRQDVGLKVKTQYRVVNDELLFDVATEMSTFEPGASIRKVTATGSGIATAGKSAVLLSLDDDTKHYDLSVTPTKLR
jgi:hypothetical protein